MSLEVRTLHAIRILLLLQFIEAGLDGIESSMKVEKGGVNHGELPEDLIPAVNALESDSCITDALGKGVSSIYIISRL